MNEGIDRWGHRRGLVVGEVKQAVSQRGVSHGVFGRALHREPERLHGLACRRANP